MSSKGTIVYCNCSFEGSDGGYDSDECSDDSESRGGRPAESCAYTHHYIEGRIFKKGRCVTCPSDPIQKAWEGEEP